MKFGVREICDVVFKAKANGSIGSMSYTVGQPVLYIESAKTSTIEGAATTVYATGGRGNNRLISWEGEKTLTFTVEDALLSPVGFAMLSGAGLFEPTSSKPIYVHKVVEAMLSSTGVIDLTDALTSNENVSTKSPVFVMTLDRGSISGILGNTPETKFTYENKKLTTEATVTAGPVLVDFYVEKQSGAMQLEIDMGNFAGYWYVEGSTLFRRQSDGVDMPAEIIFPNVKIQSNFTFNLASTGDPSTFTFTMDAMPGYTRFDLKKRVLCAIQIVDDNAAGSVEGKDSVGNDADDEKQYPLP